MISGILNMSSKAILNYLKIWDQQFIWNILIGQLNFCNQSEAQKHSKVTFSNKYEFSVIICICISLFFHTFSGNFFAYDHASKMEHYKPCCWYFFHFYLIQYNIWTISIAAWAYFNSNLPSILVCLPNSIRSLNNGYKKF